MRFWIGIVGLLLPLAASAAPTVSDQERARIGAIREERARMQERQRVTTLLEEDRISFGRQIAALAPFTERALRLLEDEKADYTSRCAASHDLDEALGRLEPERLSPLGAALVQQHSSHSSLRSRLRQGREMTVEFCGRSYAGKVWNRGDLLKAADQVRFARTSLAAWGTPFEDFNRELSLENGSDMQAFLIRATRKLDERADSKNSQSRAVTDRSANKPEGAVRPASGAAAPASSGAGAAAPAH